MSELDTIRKLLEAFYGPAEIEQWLNSPHPQLNDRRAIDLVQSGPSGVAEVRRVIARLDDGAYI